MKKTKNILIVLFIALSSFGFWAFKDSNFAIAKNLDIFYTLFREMNMIYVDETDPEQMVKTAIDAMLEKLDPYTVYIPESQVENYKFMTTGQYGGIGAIIRKRGDGVLIAEPYENCPAAKAGLQAGDKILKIDNVDAKDKNTEQMSELLKGEPGSSFQMLIERPGKSETMTIDIEREKIQIAPVPYHGMLNDSVGYFLLRNFSQSASTEVKKAVQDLVEQGAKSLVFDLRGNGGGLLIQSVNIVNLFVGKGNEVVSTKGRVSQWDKTYKTKVEGAYLDLPMVVLVNNRSASASEIVSGSLQDLDRAVIVGTRTFGKGLVQTTRPLSYNTQLKVTTAKYYIPSGRCIQALDYSHRNEDGSVGNVPDSLKTEFTTRNNRKVYDGGGILPDITIEQETMSSIAFSLLANDYVFDYATEYKQRYPNIPDAKDFQMSDQEYNEFIQWMKDKDLEYESASENQLEKLIEVAKAESYYEHSKDQLETLRKVLASDREKDLSIFKDQISRMLQEEIVTRYYYQKGSIENMLQKDKNVLKALEILGNKNTYETILAGAYEEGNVKK